jgi:hypothetical protein
MNDISNERAVIGGNLPPVKIDLEQRYPEIFNRLKELEGQALLIPSRIEGDDDAGKVQDLIKMMRHAVKMAKSTMELETEPLKDKVKQINAAFKMPMELLEKVMDGAKARLDDYLKRKEELERKRREEEAARIRAEQDAKEREAREAEARRIAAEKARLDEERKAREAEEVRARAVKEREEAERRAEQARADELRLKAERAEREAREARDRAEKKVRDEQEAAEREIRLAAERKAEAEAKERRRVADEEAAEAKRKADIAKAEQRAAEAAATEAKREEKSAGRDAVRNLDTALRLERQGDRMDTKANAGSAEMSRTRGELGTVGSLAQRWTYHITDMDNIPLERLRGYLNPGAIEAAVTRFKSAHLNELTDGNTTLLPGVTFERLEEARVA